MYTNILPELLPELKERILSYCTVQDVKNLSQCNSVYSYSFKEKLWQSVKIPWNCLTEEHFETACEKQLENLCYTKTLAFWTDKTHSRMNESISQMNLDRVSENYITILNYCNGKILHTLAVRNGVFLSSPTLKETSESLYNLKILTIENTMIPDSGFSDLTKLLNLVQLNLEDMSRCTNDSNFISICEGLPNLDMLNVRKTTVSEDALSHLTKLVSLKELNIGNSTIDNSGMLHVSRLTNLSVLRMGGCLEVDDDGISYLPSLTLLEELDIYCCKGITDAAALSLCKLRSLRKLNVSFNKITDAGVKILTSLSNLVELNISGTKVSDSGVYHLTKLTLLEKLSLRQTLIGDDAIGHLSSSPSLRNLSLQTCHNISDVGLTRLLKMPCLKCLNIKQVPVDEVGLRTLAALKHLEILKCDKKVYSGLCGMLPSIVSTVEFIY